MPHVPLFHETYRADIGIEVHVQLTTQSKMFCHSPNGPADEPNTHIDPICTGQPGTLPMVNKRAVEYAVMAGLATNCTINTYSAFDRKHYFYPDLPKGYQITQDEYPICEYGSIPVPTADGATKHVRIKRIHMEEDAGKNMHAKEGTHSHVDLNRAGSPLLEIVSEPDISSPEEAKAYLKALHAIVTTLGITTGNMEEGAFRADTNLSVRKKDAEELGTRCELKNINSFKFIGDAVAYEIDRHIACYERGEDVRQETRLWNTHAKKTVTMRSKEEAENYRYFADPDLPPLILDHAFIDSIRATLPELPQQQMERLQTTYGITREEAEILFHEPQVRHFFEETRSHTDSPKTINWVVRNLMGYLKEHERTLEDIHITPQKLANLVDLVDKGTINTRVAQDIFAEIAQSGGDPRTLVQERGLEQMSDETELKRIVQDIIDANPQQVAAYKGGKERLLSFFVGQAMKATKGKANPQALQKIAHELLNED